MLGDIARLMAERMAYEDPIRIAQLKLAGLDEARRARRIRRGDANSGSTNWSRRCRP